MNYLDEIKPLEDAGFSDEQIAVYGSYLTKFPVIVTSVRSILFAEELISDFGDSGPLAEAIRGVQLAAESLPAGQEQDDGLRLAKLGRWFLHHVYKSGSERVLPLDGKSTPGDFISPRDVIFGMAALMPQVIADFAQRERVRLAIAAAGGGLRYPAGVTAADVAADRQAYQDGVAELARQESIEALRAEIENTWIHPAIADGVSAVADVRAAIKAGI